MNRHVLITGCSGGGKSTLLEELARRGFRVVEEPGRRIVREQREGDGHALPWVDPVAFARGAIDMALRDHAAVAGASGWTFFDRGLIDAAAALEHMTGEPVLDRVGAAHSYHQQVFLAPPWPAIYRTDAERRHGFDEAVAEYDRLVRVCSRLGYQSELLPPGRCGGARGFRDRDSWRRIECPRPRLIAKPPP